MSDRYVRLLTKLVDDPEFQALTPLGRLLYYTLKPALQRIGIGVLYSGQIEAQSGLDAVRVEAAANDLEARGWLRRQGHVWWLLRYSLESEDINPKNVNQRKGLVNRVANLPDCTLVTRFRERHTKAFPGLIEAPSKTPASPFEDPSKTPASPFEDPTNGLSHGDPSKGIYPQGDVERRPFEDPSKGVSRAKREREREKEKEITALSAGRFNECGLTPCICGQCRPQEQR